MTSTAILLLAVSVLAHAFWNLLGKRQGPSAAFFLIASVTAAVCLAPLLLVYSHALSVLPTLIWWLVTATGLFEAIYYIGLGGAYRQGSMSLAYPLARAVPVLLITGVSLALGRANQISRLALVGIATVSIGCLILPLPNFRDTRLKHYLNTCCALALAAAMGTSGYTMVDDEALRQLRELPRTGMGNTELTLLYAALQAVSTSVALTVYTLLYAPERQRLKKLWNEARLPAALTGLIITATYGLVLASMAYVTNVSYVVAFRQLSIPLGALLGIFVQKEPPYRPKLIGTGIVFAGLLMIGVA